MRIDMFTHSEWFGKEIYVSPNGNVYCLYPFDGIKTLIIDEDLKFEQYKKYVEGTEEPKDFSDVMVYWLYSEFLHQNIRIQHLCKTRRMASLSRFFSTYLPYR